MSGEKILLLLPMTTRKKIYKLLLNTQREAIYGVAWRGRFSGVISCNSKFRYVFPDPLVTAKCLISDHVTKFAEGLENILPSMARLKVGKRLYLALESGISLGLPESIEGDNHEAVSY